MPVVAPLSRMAVALSSASRMKLSAAVDETNPVRSNVVW